jgi:hypothetical protein
VGANGVRLIFTRVGEPPPPPPEGAMTVKDDRPFEPGNLFPPSDGAADVDDDKTRFDPSQ